MADTQINKLAVKDAPADFIVPNGVEFVLKAVNAEFTDVSAASDWLPALVILSDSGHVIARAADQAVKVTAGDDAEVSWFPGVKHASGGGGSTAAPYMVAYSAPTLGDANQSIPNNAATTATFLHTKQAGGLFTWDAGTSTIITATRGLYEAIAFNHWDAVGLPWYHYSYITRDIGGVDGSMLGPMNPGQGAGSNGADFGQDDQNLNYLFKLFGGTMAFSMVVYQTSGIAKNLSQYRGMLVRLVGDEPS